ncbi:MAG: DNA primase [Acidipila sp.]|nr:DNA primase [Acidipila sp.]
MAEAGSFADKVKTQADIVRVIGEYVRLKKSGQNFMGLCPFHSEKSSSFAVHPVRQIYHCFGCGVGGDVFKFIMEVDKCTFPEAVRAVAEKCGIPIPRQRTHDPAEQQASSQRKNLLALHKDAAAWFAEQLMSTVEGKIARGYLEDRGLDRETIAQFGLGYAPSAGDALLRQFRGKYQEKLLDASGLISRDPSSRAYDRFRRRVIFPIANDTGKVIAFGGRALGDDLPKYLNSPETPIYTKSTVLYNFDRAKEPLRRLDFAVLVEGYMDAIGVARAGVGNVVASCGTSLTEPQVRLLGRFTRRVVVNYDADTAGQAATERSLTLLLSEGFDVRVLALPGGADPDQFIREQGGKTYQKLLGEAPAFLDYLIRRAQKGDLASAAGKVRAVNSLLPYIQRMPDRLLRSEWATRVSQQLRIDEPVLRESLRRAAAERRSEVKLKTEHVAGGARPSERRLIRMLVDADDFRDKLAEEIRANDLQRGLGPEKIFTVLLDVIASGQRPDPAYVGDMLEEPDRRLLNEIVFEPSSETTWEEAESCLAALRRRRLETELTEIQRKIAAGPEPADMRALLELKQKLSRELAESSN